MPVSIDTRVNTPIMILASSLTVRRWASVCFDSHSSTIHGDVFWLARPLQLAMQAKLSAAD